MTTHRNIHISVADVQRQVAELLAACPGLADDEDLRADTLEGSTDLHELLARLTGAALNAKQQEAAIAARLDALKVRRDAAKARQERIRGLLQRLMEESGLRKVSLPEATLSLGKVAPAVVVTDEDQIPADYFRIKSELDKSKLKAALKDGTIVPGASLGNGGIALTIRGGA